jgi:hypothetical protein
MKIIKLTPFVLIIALLASCTGPLVIAGVGAVAGVWTIDEFRNDSGEMILQASPRDVFATAENIIASYEGLEEYTVTPGSLRIEFEQNKIHYSVMVMLIPENDSMCKLRVIAAEFGLRGRAELAEELATKIAAAL